jgi:hypothetical protein
MRGKVNRSEFDTEYLPPKELLAQAATYQPLVYHGGPILSEPELVSLYWGPFQQNEIQTMQAWLVLQLLFSGL